MSKLSITNHFNGTTMPNTHFLVQTAAEAQQISALGYSAHVITMGDEMLTNWGRTKGLAEADLMGFVGPGKEFILLLPRFIRESDKVKKLSSELGKFLKNAGSDFYTPQSDPGSSVPDLIEHFGDSLHIRAMSDFGLCIQTEAEEGATVTGGEDEDAGTTLYKIVKDHFTLARTRDGQTSFLLPNEKAGLGYRAYEIGSSELRGWMYRTYRKLTGQVIPGSGIVAVVEATLEGECAVSTARFDLRDRATYTKDGSVWLDLGNDLANAVKIKDGAWSLESFLPYSTGTAFRRTEAITEIQPPAMIKCGDARMELEMHLKPYVNAREQDWPLIAAWMITHMIPDTANPILMFLATSGSGKSTATNAIKYAVEGGYELGESEDFKDNEDDCMVTLSKARVTPYDNVSKISEALSDRLCKVVYGTTYSKRKLRTDDEVKKLYINSSLIMNGIETGQLRVDLKERMVMINLNGSVAVQMGTKALKENIVASHPRIFGALLSLMAQIIPMLKEAPAFETTGPDGYRMQDYVKVLWAIDQLWGTKGVETYRDMLNGMATDALDDPLLLTVVKLVRNHGTRVDGGAWEGTIGASEIHQMYEASTFLDRMTTATGGREKLNVQSIGGKLTRAEKEWLRVGVQFKRDDTTSDGRKLLRGKQQKAYWFRVNNEELVDSVRTVL